MSEVQPPVGITEQVATRLVFEQLDAGRSTELKDKLDEISKTLGRLSIRAQQSVGTSSRFPLGRFIHKVSAVVLRRHLAPMRELDQELIRELARTVRIMTELLDDHNTTSAARLRFLQESIMDRIAVVDAISAKVSFLEKKSRNI